MLNKQQVILLRNGVSHLQNSRLGEASRIFAQLRSLAPNAIEPFHYGAICAINQGKHGEALPLLKQAHLLSPKNDEVAFLLGKLYSQQGRLQEAEPLFRLSSESKPDNAEPHLLWAKALQGLNRLDEAIKVLMDLTTRQPECAKAWQYLGIYFSLKSQMTESLEAHERALEIDPDLPDAYFGRAMARQHCHRVKEALDDYETQLKRNPTHKGALSYRLMAMHYLSNLSNEYILDAHQRFGSVIETHSLLVQNAERRFPNPPALDRRLRIAFLSPDLRIHSVAFFLQPLLAELDRNQFEVILYADHFIEDAFTQVLKKAAKVWRNFNGQSDDRVEAVIRSDSPDILIDLAGHTGMNRLHLYARRLAPVQITYLGYPNTTGLKSMDYRLSDAIADPEGSADAFCSEKILRFSPTAWCFWPPPGSPDPAPAPCLAKGHITFGSFNSLIKFSEDTLRMWANILRAMPSSRMLFKSARSDGLSMPERFASLGIDPVRIEQIPSTPSLIEHIATYSKVDITLDPYPYNGTTTTCEALWMGLPVITLKGDRHASRVGASLLTAVGHAEWIAQTAEEYESKAIALAQDHALLARLRQQLRGQMKSSLILDSKSQAAYLGRALRESWQTWCTGRVSP